MIVIYSLKTDIDKWVMKGKNKSKKNKEVEKMRKIERLKREALESCKFRGHKMKRFLDYKSFSVSSCRVCNKSVIVVPLPPPNGINIRGEAVALGCVSLCTRPSCDCVACMEC